MTRGYRGACRGEGDRHRALARHPDGGEPDEARTAGAPQRSAEQLSAALDVLDVPSDAVVDPATVLDIEREANALGNAELEMRARLVRARALRCAGETTAAAGLLWEVNEWATQRGCRMLRAGSHRDLVWIYYLLGDPAAALDHAARAMELLDESTPAHVRVQHLGTLALALNGVKSFDAARERFAEAEQIMLVRGVSAEGGVYLLMNVLNNLLVNEHEAGEHERASEAAGKMLALSAAQSFPLNAVFSHTVALAQIGAGQLDEAARTLQTCLAERHQQDGKLDHLPDVLLSLAEVQRRQGHPDRAQATLDDSRRVCTERGLRECLVRVQQEQAELYAATGQMQRAFETYKAFHADAEALYSLERSAQARIRRAIQEITEARRQAEQFREQARRDPLTGLRNRRFVDEELPGLIDLAVQSWTPLSLALVDLDHFKRINDGHSHVVGDQVLVLVARIIATSIATSIEPTVADAGFVARMGGDEFLVVLPGLGPAPATRLLEAVRMTVESYHWEPITGDLEVSVSVGAATTRLGHNTQSELLGRADQHLYAAKQPGRNRVVTDLDTFTDEPDRPSTPGRTKRTWRSDE